MSFIATIASFVAGLLKRGPVFSDPYLGRYKKHHVKMGDFDWGVIHLNHDRSLMWPVEAKVVIEFERGQHVYIGFNMSFGTLRKLMNLTDADLIRLAKIEPTDKPELMNRGCQQLTFDGLCENRENLLLSSVTAYSPQGET